MSQNFNKIAQKIISAAWEKHALAGFYPETHFERGPMGVSFYVFERGDAERPYYFIAHEWLKENVDPAGLYTKKRAGSTFESLARILDPEPWNEEHLKPGHKVWLKALRDISTKYRRGEIGQIDMLKSDGIVDLVNMVEEHGYQDTYGSCYSWEIVIVRDQLGLWHPFVPKMKQPKGE